MLVLGSLEYDATTTVTRGNGFVRGDHSFACHGKFLVWDYQRSRALTEGSVQSSVSFGKEITSDNLKTLASSLVSEILVKRPFKRSAW